MVQRTRKLPARKSSEADARDHLRQTIRKKHDYDTCNKQQMNLPTARSKAYRNSFLFKGLQDFQLLPNEIKSEQHKLKLIRKCKQNLLK